MKSVFRSVCVIFLVFTAALAITGCARHPKPAENIASPPPAPALTEQEMKNIVVARVNGVEIHGDALVRMMNIMSANTPTTLSSGSREDLKKNAMDQVVLRELALQQAARLGLRVEQRDLSHAMDNFIRSVGHDEGFQIYLEKEHTTEEEVRSQIERSLLLQQLFNKEVLQKVSVSEDEVQKEFESLKGKYVREGKQMSFEEAKDPIEKRLKAAAQMRRIKEWEQELKKDAKIEIRENGGSQAPDVGSQK